MQAILRSEKNFLCRVKKVPQQTDRLMFQIRYVSARDAGRYECQVSTVPKISKFFQLKVIIPKVNAS